MTEHTVHSDRLDLKAWTGPDNGPTVLFVHGYPDTHAVWDPVMDRLADRFRCLTYDVRGAGASGTPASRDGYELANLVTDLVAVMDTLSPERPVHLVAHDWGSIQAWEAVVRARWERRLTGRIASYTTISGPCLAHLQAFVAAARHGGWDRRREALTQAVRSWYIYAFCVPVLPEPVLRSITKRPALVRALLGTGHFGPTLPRDAAAGVNLYRANMNGYRPPPQGATTKLPVQLVVPTKDRYVDPAVYRDLASYAPDLTRAEITGGHWVPRSHPDRLAAAITDFVLAHPLE
ncbi:MAG: alpha/beta fold hydrolase [Nocardioidaceae bacterium]